MLCVELDVNNTLVANSQTVENCTTFLLMEKQDYNILVQPLTISPEQIGFVFAWGFSAVLTFWFFGYVVGVIKSVIRQA
ncbi:MAG: hypothetical protein COA94_08065 [Rickettsiales bacterium]|nr:MAG: hypothetical protein COA94_08065 [Rickettsiales bacterium]